MTAPAIISPRMGGMLILFRSSGASRIIVRMTKNFSIGSVSGSVMSSMFSGSIGKYMILLCQVNDFGRNFEVGNGFFHSPLPILVSSCRIWPVSGLPAVVPYDGRCLGFAPGGSGSSIKNTAGELPGGMLYGCG